MKKTGRYVDVGGFKAFIPASLSKIAPSIKIEGELQEHLEQATLFLARLDGLGYTLPNSDLFIAMYVRKEALLSSQIEGTQASLQHVLAFERGAKLDNINDVEEVINYINALDYGIEKLSDMPMSLRLIKELHSILLRGVRGKQCTPGEFRKVQNWIGPTNSTPKNATLVPPPPQEAKRAMEELELYMHEPVTVPHLVNCALIHYQFETIHPFLDGNGRLGRLLITFYLFWKGILQKPLLYLSYYFKNNRQEYYDRLTMVRTTGNYEQWIMFFLKGVTQTSKAAIDDAKKILELREQHRELLWVKNRSSQSALVALENFFYMPVVSVKDVQNMVGVTYQAASNLVNQFEKLGILKESTGKKRDKRYVYTAYVEILSEGTR